MSSTVAWPELMFTLPAMIGFLLNWWAFNDAVADLHFLQARGLNGAREVIARASCRNEALRAGIQVMFLLLGLYLLITPPIDAGQPVTAASIAVSFVILVAEFLMVIKAALDRRDRHRVIDILARRRSA